MVFEQNEGVLLRVEGRDFRAYILYGKLLGGVASIGCFLRIVVGQAGLFCAIHYLSKAGSSAKAKDRTTQCLHLRCPVAGSYISFSGHQLGQL